MARKSLPLLDPPDDLDALSIADRCRHFARQVEDYHADPFGRGLLEVTKIGRVLAEAAAALDALLPP